MLDQQRDYVLRSVEERGVRLVRLWFTDVLGTLKSLAISPAELDNALSDGMSFDGSSIDGFSRVQESDVLAMPDPDTFELLPWGDPKAPEARIFCDIHHLDGTPFEGDPRQVLRRHVQAAHDKGLTFYVAPDVEFFYFKPIVAGRSRPYRSTRAGTSTSPPTTSPANCASARSARWRTMGIPVEYSFHEDAPGQQEIDLRHTDALTMADSMMTFRLVVREVAARDRRARHVHAQAARGRAGLGHARPPVAVPRRRERVPRRRRRRTACPTVAKSFMAGLLRHAAEITAVTNQTVNSYKRLVPGFEAPGPRQLGPQQPQRPDPGADPEARQPARHPDRVPFGRSGDCNPYLAFSLMLAAGMRGIEEGYELPDEADANLFEIGDEVLEKLGVKQIPQSLAEALAAMERSTLVQEALGEHIFEWFLRNKRSEWRGYKTHVSRVRARSIPDGALMASRRRSDARRRARPGVARSGAHARSRRLQLEGGRGRFGGVRAANRRADGPARSSTRRPIPRAPGRSCGRCASTPTRRRR